MLLEAPTRFTTPVMIATTGFGVVRWTGILALKMNNVFFLGGVPAKWPRMPAIRRISMLLLCALCCTTSPLGASDAPPPQINHPLSLAEVLDLAILNNPEIQKSRKDLEATEGVVLQTRAIAWPKLQVTGNYAAKEPSAVDKPGILIPGFTFGTDQSWQSQVRVVQIVADATALAARLKNRGREAPHEVTRRLVRNTSFTTLRADHTISNQGELADAGRQLADYLVAGFTS